MRGLLKLTSMTQFVAVIFALGLLASCSTQSRLTGEASGPPLGGEVEGGGEGRYRGCEVLDYWFSVRGPDHLDVGEGG